MEFTIQKIAENIWAIEQKGVRAFLLVGQDNAILVDTCFGEISEPPVNPLRIIPLP